MKNSRIAHDKTMGEFANIDSNSMLQELHIRNFSIIDDITIEFADGFNVLTGETGAGKSIIINALSLAAGERASGDLVRSGEKEGLVEALFHIRAEALKPSTRQFLSDNGIDCDNGLLLKRIISDQGRSRAYINGSMVTVQTLSDVSREIIDIHGQYEHQSLLSSENQLDLVDAYGGLIPLRKTFAQTYGEHLSARNELRREKEREQERAQRTDMLQYQIQEIEAAQLSPEEEDALSAELKRLSNSERLAELANSAYESLYGSDAACISALSSVLQSLQSIAEIDPVAEDSKKYLEESLPLLEEAAFFLRDYRDGIEFSPERLAAVQERLELIRTLKRKYGATIPEVLDYLDNARSEREALEHWDENLQSLNSTLEELSGQMTIQAQELSGKRIAAAKKINKQVEAELSDLAMEGTQFSVHVSQTGGTDTRDGFAATEHGIDSVAFLIAPNIGEELRPVARIASGGELSRIMLALKRLQAKDDKTPVLIFDEVDSGIGGETARVVGHKLSSLAKFHQIISITHLPQIAACASSHYKIEKKRKGKRTVVSVQKMQDQERTEEVARMLSGTVSEQSLEHAREMLSTGKN